MGWWIVAAVAYLACLIAMAFGLAALGEDEFTVGYGALFWPVTLLFLVIIGTASGIGNLVDRVRG